MKWISLNTKNEEKKANWYDQFINHIPEPIEKSIVGFKDKIASLFKTTAPKETVHGRREKLSKTKTQNVRNPFILKKKKVNYRQNNQRYLDTF